MNSYSLNYCQEAYVPDHCPEPYGESMKSTLTELGTYQETTPQHQGPYATYQEYHTSSYYVYDPYGYNPNIIRAEQAYTNYLNSFGVAPNPVEEHSYGLEEEATTTVLPSMDEPQKKQRGRKRKQVNYEEDSEEEEESRNSSKRKWKASSPTTNFEFAGEIDTQRLADEVHVTMCRLKIPQTKFALKVINRSQGTLSDLLKRPKPWEALQPKGKQTYEMMRQWLQLSDSRKIAAVEGESEDCYSPEKKPSPSKVCKKRLSFTPVQRRVLEAIFEKDNYPTEETQQVIANKLRVDISTVKNFMQNRRNRGRRELSRSRRSPATGIDLRLSLLCTFLVS